MNIRRPPEDLALDLTHRSTAHFRIAAVIYDNHGIFSWGWNHKDKYPSTHGEEHAIERANRRRLAGATIVVAGKSHSGRIILARPCADCVRKIINASIRTIIYSDPNNPIGWSEMKI